MRRGLTAVAGAVLAFGLVACGDDSGAGSSGGEGSSDGSLTVHKDMVALVAAATDAAKEKQTAKLTMSGLVEGDGAVRMTDSGAEVTMTGTSGGQPMEMRLVGGNFYMKLDAETATAAKGKEWMLLASDGDDPMSKLFGGMATQMSDSVDPSKAFDNLKGAKITSSSETELDGTPVVHYKIAMDVDAMVEQAAKQMAQMSGGEVTDEMREGVKKMFADRGVDSLPAELWVDGDDLMRKFLLPDMSKLMGAEGSGGPTEMSVVYSDWGAEVDIAAPPEDKVATPKEIFGN